MIRFLLSRFVYRRAHGDGMETRTQLTFFAGILGILCNLFLFALKLVIGMLAGSVAITSDAFNNLSDAGSSVITLVGFKFSGMKPDKDHPFGHGRIEYVSGLAVSVLIIVMGVEVFKTSVQKILHPEQMELSVLTMVILFASIAVKVYMSFYNRILLKHLHEAP